MQSPASSYVTLVEAFELTVPLDEVAPILRAVMARLEVEGVASLVSMQFYTSDVPGEMGAIIRFSDPHHFTEHVKMISGWEEFKRFSSMIKLIEIRVHGELSPEVEAWMQQFGGPVKKLRHFVAGFVRTP